MSGYSKLEQTVGGVLDRFPRLKRNIERAYQRANYHLFHEQGFEYKLHDAATLQPVEKCFDVPTTSAARFVGFFDVQPWDPSMERFLCHEVEKGRDGAIVCFEQGEVTTLASTDAWNFQQGSRTQWHPTRDDQVLFNDIEDGRPVGKLVDIDGNHVETFTRPIQAVHPTDPEYLSIEYRRLDNNDPGYGYGTGDDTASIPAVEDDGIYRVSLTGETELFVALSELLEYTDQSVPQQQHYLHHVCYAPDGNRIAFLHRWNGPDGQQTQLFVAEADGTLQCLAEDPYLSHFCWLDSERLFLWGRSNTDGKGYHILDVSAGSMRQVAALDGFGDGHPSLSPEGQWLVFDTYPDRARKRHLTLYHPESSQAIALGAFFSPFGFDGTERCDLHPRWSPDGSFVSIDSTHEGVRRSYVIDVSDIVE